MSLNPNEQAMVRAILVAAKVKRSDIEWMVASCPSIEKARALFSRTYRQPADPPKRKAGLCAGVSKARDRVLDARRSGDEQAVVEAMSSLLTEIEIVRWRCEQEAAGVKLPELDAATERALEALP